MAGFSFVGQGWRIQVLGKDMLLAVDVFYGASCAFAAGVVFEHWHASTPDQCFVSRLSPVAHYAPGHFYERELPCILHLLHQSQIKPECIIVDGYVYLDGVSRPGLGRHLFDALDGQVKVIGVAKSRFAGIGPQFQVLRGNSARPLYVTAVGMDLTTAKAAIANMHGPHRIPTLLKAADQLCRQQACSAADTVHA